MDLLIVTINGNSVGISCLRGRRGDLILQSHAVVVADGDGLAVLRQMASSGAARIVLALPASLTFSREVELPITDRRKLREVLALELKGETALDTDDLAFDALPLGNGRQLAVWTRRQESARLISLLAEHGAEPEIVTAAPFHWRHLLPEDAGAGCLAICDGHGLTVLQDGRPMLVRSVTGPEEARRSLAALEISLGVSIGGLYLHGDAAGEPPWPAEAFGDLPVRPLPVQDRELLQSAGAHAVARAVLSDEVLNFRHGDLTYRAGQERTRKGLMLSLILAGILIALLFADAAVRYYRASRDLASVNASISAIHRELFPNRKKGGNELSELKSEIKKLGGVSSHETLPVLRFLAEAKEEGISGLYEVEIEGAQVRLKGDARTPQAASEFKSRVEARFASAEIGEIKSRTDGSISFTFRGVLKEVRK